jgi:hypothetical protein
MSRRWLPLCLLAAAACNSEQAKKDAAPVESAKPKSKLDQAMQAAAAASANAAAAASAGPPPNGVFPPGRADQEQPPNAPPKITVMKTGNDPKVTLGADLAPGTEITVVVDKTKQPGGTMPTMDWTLKVVGADGKGDDKAAKAAPSAAPSASPLMAQGPHPVVFEVKKVALDEKQPGQLPEGAAKILAKLVGSKVSATLTAQGSLADVKLDVPKDAREVAPIGQAMAEALELFFPPLPAEPVGAGASWIASDRTRFSGMPLVRYRVATVQKLGAEEVQLMVDLRHYATAPDALPPGMPEGVDMIALESKGKAVYIRKLQSLAPTDGETALNLQVVFGRDGQAGQGAQMTLGAHLTPAK